MDLGLAAFLVLFVTSSLLALIRGDASLRAAGLSSFVAAIATRVVEQSAYVTVENGVLLVDTGLAAILLLIAIRSRAAWAYWCAAAQVMAILTHLARIALPDIDSVAYFDAAGIWSFPVMLLILARACKGIPAQSALGGVAASGMNSTTPTPTSLCRIEETSLLRDLILASGAKDKGEYWLTGIIDHIGVLGRMLSAPAVVLKEAGLNDRAIALFELCRRVAGSLTKSRIDGRTSLVSLEKVIEYLRLEIGHRDQEHFRVLYFDSRYLLLHDETHGIGNGQRVTIFPREIIARALKTGATILILSHNHPCGNCLPSPGDIAVTQELHGTASLFDIVIHDHIIISGSDWTSFRIEGLMSRVYNGF